MPWGDGLDVHEGNGELILVYKTRRGASGDNGAEDAVVHGDLLPGLSKQFVEKNLIIALVKSGELLKLYYQLQ